MTKVTDIIFLTDKIRRRINEYKRERSPIDNVTRHDLSAIEIAACLLELNVIRDRKITEEEMHWFQGQRFVDDSFRNDKQYSDLYYDYIKLLSYV
ncbi:hypothetical protein [Flavobacterium sp.]|uniref:hypothetical protein n=1 Tax=Flavobacterium sp. TaxID=239 RepID=UPI003B990B05